MRAKEVKPGALKLFQVVSLVLFCGLELACGSEDPPQPRTTTNQGENAEQVSNPNHPQQSEPVDGVPSSKNYANYAIEGEFLVWVSDAILDKFKKQPPGSTTEPKLLISSKRALKIWRELKQRKIIGPSSQTYIEKISQENLNELSVREEALNQVLSIIEETNLINSKPQLLRALYLLGMLVLKTDKNETAGNLAGGILAAIEKAKPGIKNEENKDIIVERNYRLELHQSTARSMPNDRLLHEALPDHEPPPKFSKLWGLDKIGIQEAWDLAEINWSHQVDGKIILAVIDTGVMAEHPDLEQNMWRNPAEDGKVPGEDDEPKNGYIDDIHGANIRAKFDTGLCGDKEIQKEGSPIDEEGHGTHVAGVAAARADNDDPPTNDNKKMVGVVGNGLVRIMALKIFCEDREKSPHGTYAHAIEAVKYASQMGAHVVNASWGILGEPSVADGEESIEDERKLLKKTIGYAEHTLFVFSAGNKGNLPDPAEINIDENKIFPASFGSDNELDNVLTVAATVTNDDFKADSFRGSKSVKIAAPGDSIYSASFAINPPHEPKIKTAGGTSVAAPFVAGCAALIQAVWQSKNPSLELLTPLKLRDILIRSGEFSDALASGVGEGELRGKRLNCKKALEEALG